MIPGASNMTFTLADRVLMAAKKYPDRPALELPDRSYTYRELIEAATTIEQSIINKAEKNPFIAVQADKSFHCYASILGILMAGKAYLPLNPRFPDARNSYMLEKAALSSPPGSKPAYLLFTSGTTGKPKGVPVSHQNVSAYLDYMLKNYDFQPEDRFTQNFDLTFDLSVHDIFLAWSAGACLCVPEDNSSFAMARFLRERKPTVWFSVPSVVMLMDRMRLLKPQAFSSVRLSFFCGEALYAKTVMAWKNAAPQSRLVNLYGPTEATIAITRYELPEDPAFWKSELGIISIGKVFEGNTAEIRDEDSRPAVKGELHLNGVQVVDGYLANEEADKLAFCTDPGSGKRWYKTGDLVRADQDEDLFFLGRKDAEVKISGYRVNLKEIENVLTAYESVEQAVVIYDPEEARGVILAFISGGNREKFIEKELDAFCREQLPWYMVPGRIIFVDEIPFNSNGKVDKAALTEKYSDGKRHQETINDITQG